MGSRKIGKEVIVKVKASCSFKKGEEGGEGVKTSQSTNINKAVPNLIMYNN
jgi:hypothetical protein